MFCIFSVLIILDYAVPSAAVAFEKFFEPGIIFIQRWLPLFYVPYLVVLPLSLKDIPASSAIKICFIVVGGWLATVCVTGLTAIGVRKAVKTELIDAEPMEKPSPFSSIEVWAWTGVLLISFAASLVFPSALGTRARTYLPFLLASSVRLHDWLRIAIKLEEGLPPNNFLCSIAELAAIALGFLSKSGLDAVLGYYLTNSSSNPGVGYIVMGFLGSVILSFAFSMFKQRKLVKRHAAEIFTCHNLYHILIVLNCHCWMSTCFRTIITVSILPRCITVALALSIVSFFEGATSVTSLVWENRHA
ncbi:plastidal glycolate/glycerate translocator 1, chloroplastic-like isoform X1 [Vigna unguiculata]|nr:plastidal glycolate/glycerate translocator 1, chloroplastic-like isoform X1 [Vigna unguiculata]